MPRNNVRTCSESIPNSSYVSWAAIAAMTWTDIYLQGQIHGQRTWFKTSRFYVNIFTKMVPNVAWYRFDCMVCLDPLTRCVNQPSNYSVQAIEDQGFSKMAWPKKIVTNICCKSGMSPTISVNFSNFIVKLAHIELKKKKTLWTRVGHLTDRGRLFHQKTP